MDRFTAPWDRGLTVTTWALGLLVGGLALVVPALGLLLAGPGQGPSWPLVLPAAALAILPVAWALAPRGYALDGGDLVVERPLWPIRLPLASIRAVGLLPREAIRGGLRVFGGSGLFGHFGRFWSPALGHFRLYATRSSGLVGIDTARGRLVLSPEPPEAFVEAVRRRAPRAAHDLALSRSASRRHLGWWIAGGTVLLLAALVGGLFVGLRAFAPCGASVEGESIRVERRWARPVELPLAQVRSAARLAPGDLQGWRRLDGTALGDGVAYGLFGSTRLGRFRLYAWRRGPLVLLETTAGRVVLTPDDPDAFVAEVVARLGR